MRKTSAWKKAGWMGAFFLLLVVGMEIIGNSNTPPASKTGAPNENKCIQCHGGTAGTGSISMVFGNNETQYVPGQQYTVQVTNLDPTKIQFGFQVTALAGGVGATVGTFGLTNTANTSTQTATVTGFLRKYVSHRAANSNQNWSFTWTAPATDIGPITFFLLGVAAN
ncbi:MAG TPA: Reeler domain-containing protein, partial [Bacteroidia bacterium]|nr:Reeler domain-containing protein [Bacteroidia bacterium]